MGNQTRENSRPRSSRFRNAREQRTRGLRAILSRIGCQTPSFRPCLPPPSLGKRQQRFTRVRRACSIHQTLDSLSTDVEIPFFPFVPSRLRHPFAIPAGRALAPLSRDAASTGTPGEKRTRRRSFRETVEFLLGYFCPASGLRAHRWRALEIKPLKTKAGALRSCRGERMGDAAGIRRRSLRRPANETMKRSTNKRSVRSIFPAYSAYSPYSTVRVTRPSSPVPRTSRNGERGTPISRGGFLRAAFRPTRTATESVRTSDARRANVPPRPLIRSLFPFANRSDEYPFLPARLAEERRMRRYYRNHRRYLASESATLNYEGTRDGRG